MNFLIYIILIYVLGLGGAAALLFFNKKAKIVLRILTIAAAFCFLMRHLWGAPAYSGIIKLILPPIFENAISKPLEIISFVFIWLTNINLLAVCLAPFFDVKYNQKLISFFCLPVAVMSTAFFFVNAKMITGETAFDGFNGRVFFYALETALILCLSLVHMWRGGKFSITKSELKNLLIWFVPMLLATMPIYTLQIFFGSGQANNALDLSFMHRLMIYASFVFLVALYLIFKKKDMELKRYTVLFLSLATLISYSQNFPFSSFVSPRTIPLHLCNTAMYIIPICLIFKTEKLFYFTYFINVLGAFLAIALPNYGETAYLSPGFISFWLNHWCAFFMPLLIVALGVFERPKTRHFKYSMIGFGSYFILILVINAYCGDTDYFFLNSDFIISKFPSSWERILDIELSFSIGEKQLIFYPLYQGLFFLVYFAAAFGMWFIYENGFLVSEKLHELFERKKKIRQDEIMFKTELSGRRTSEPINPDGANKIVISRFSKKYGSSKSFAVENLDLEIYSGEIFGFLGPNGSGKSTVIKSLVGLQPITSGTMEVCGYDVEKQSLQAKQRIGFVPDHYALYEKLTGREYINYIADLYQISGEERTKRMNHFLELFELAYAFDNQIKTYSHGMKQKIAIIAALIHNPRIWILDEPLTGLDPNSIFQVKETMRAHAADGNIVFFSSHIMDVVEKICDRIAIIRKGHIIAKRAVKDIEAAGIPLEQYYLQAIQTGTEPDLTNIGQEQTASIKA